MMQTDISNNGIDAEVVKVFMNNGAPSGYMASEIEKVQEIVTLPIPHLPYIASDDTRF